MYSPAVAADRPEASISGRVAGATIAVLLIVMLAAAISVDVVRAGYGVKGDEATYVAMGLSAAYDHDLAYQRRDLERFWGLYRAGPEGLFLKRGRDWHVRWRPIPPFLTVSRTPDRRTDRLFFGKAFVYPLVAAPFVRAVGLNGFLVLHALLIGGVLTCGYLFLAARSRPLPALLFTIAFVGATVVPVYAVLLTSDLLNFALVFFAYFFWLYKEVARPGGSRILRSDATDALAAILLGIATFSKLTNALLIGPVVLLLWWRRRFARGFVAAVVFLATMGVLLGANAWSTGEFNYQGGDRKTFYGRYPFDAPDGSWDRVGSASATNDADTASVLEPSELPNRFGHNVEYFLVGRHHGFLPYFFPGLLAILLWIASSERTRPWRVFILLALTASVVLLLLFFPYSWNGGGGSPGNRYFLSLYPATFFLMPPLGGLVWPLLAWAVGALFTAHMVVNPFVAAKYTYLMYERGAARRLPVEVTMANDLPVMLSTAPIRGRIPYRNDPLMLLYFLDQNAFPPEPPGMWVTGGRRADIIVRTENPTEHLAVTAESPIATTLTMSMGGPDVTVRLTPHVVATFNVPARGVRGFHGYAYLLSAFSSDGFVPHLLDPQSADGRNLGALMRFQAVPASP